MRVAAIDCGTNSIRLLIAEGDGDGALRDVHREMRIVRLGQDVDRTGRLAPEALERTRVALAEYSSVIERAAVARTRMVATSATRDAANRNEFAAMVTATLGQAADVISGAEEATLSFTGAAGTLPGVPEPVLVVDIGGGSTELVLGSRTGALRAHSMDIGAVRLTERHLADDPPTPGQVAAVEADVRAALAQARREVPVAEAAALVGVAGTITTLAALALGLSEYDSSRVHGCRLSADTIHELADQVVGMSRDQRRQHPVIHPGRVDVIGGGAIILRIVVEQTGVREVIVSEHDILDGIALSLLD